MNASLGTATSTRADTAARHMQACRVNYEHLKLLSGNKPESEFLNNKFRYCMHKDELAISVVKPMFREVSINASVKYPYPSVVTTLGDVDTQTKNFICWANHISTEPDYEMKIKNARDALGDKGKVISQLREYTPVGYSVGLAYAHASSGDNIASVMIGGVVTVPNGHFEMYTGDMVQFYWDFESCMFDQDGSRLENDYPNPNDVPKQDEFMRASQETMKRQKYFDRQQNGMQRDNRKKNIPMVKPYVRNKGKQVFADNNRVFAKCISHARPFDMVDILICRQAM